MNKWIGQGDSWSFRSGVWGKWSGWRCKCEESSACTGGAKRVSLEMEGRRQSKIEHQALQQRPWFPLSSSELMMTVWWECGKRKRRAWDTILQRRTPLWIQEPREEFARSLISSVPSKSWNKKWWANLYAPTLTFLNRCAPWAGGSIRER